jgi:GT2 family glycosyltransferase
VTSISVVLPNYNGKSLLEKNLPSLHHALQHVDHEIIVVDDASTDDSVVFLKKNYPNILLITRTKNSGFSVACNAGLALASKQRICIANTDVRFSPDYFVKILPVIQGNVFAAKGRIRNELPDGTFVNFDTTARSFLKRGFWRFDKTPFESQRQGFSWQIGGRFCLLGCCFVADAKKLKDLKGFDEIFTPFYWEDSDLPFRALQAGYDLRYVPDAEVTHEVSSTINRYRKKALRKLVSDRNKFLFAWRYLSGVGQWSLHIGYTLVSLLFRWIKLDWSYYAALGMALMRTLFNWLSALNNLRSESFAKISKGKFS